MAESRDANDPRGLLRALRREAQDELDRQQQHDTGGQEHASAAERRGEAAVTSSPEAETVRELARSTHEQSDADALAVPRGDAATGGGGNAARGEPPMPGEKGREP